MSLSADDRAALSDLVHSYAAHVDERRFDSVAALFTDTAVLVVEGGLDPLLPLGGQAPFLRLSDAPGGGVLTWPDGEHTIYNHAAQRNAQVADWFARHLAGGS